MKRLQKTCMILASVLAMTQLPAVGQPDDLPDPQGQKKIYVPIGELARVVDPADKTLLMDREAFEKLLTAARANAAGAEKPLAQILQADFRAQVTGDRVEITGSMQIRSLSDKPVAIDLPFALVGLLEVRLDDAPAALNYDSRGQLRLVVSGAGRHDLTIRAAAGLQEISGGRMQMQLVVPPAVAAGWTLKLPGDQEALANVPIASTDYDPQSDTTTVKLTTGGVDRLAVVLAGNGRQDADRAILLGDVTSMVQLSDAAARLDGYVSVQVLRRGAGQLALLIDPAWTVLNVDSPDLVSWDVQTPAIDAPKRIVVNMRNAVRGSKLLRIEATAAIEDDSFRAPRLRLAGADYQRGYLLLDTGKAFAVRSETLENSRRQDMAQAHGLARMLGGAERMYYHWSDDWSVSLGLSRLELKRQVEMRQLAWIDLERMQLQTQFDVTPLGSEMFDLTLKVPPAEDGWQLASLTVNGSTEGFSYRLDEQASLLRIELASGVRAESLMRVDLVLDKPLPAALDKALAAGEQDAKASVPILSVRADEVSGLVAVSAVADLAAEAEVSAAQLEHVPTGRLASLGLDSSVTAAWQFDQAVEGKVELRIGRRTARMTASTVGLVRIEPTGLDGRFAISWRIDRASTRRLYALVDKRLGSNVRFEVSNLGVSASIVEPSAQTLELAGDVAEAWNLWQLDLDARSRGRLTAMATYQVPLGKDRTNIPLIRAAGVERGSLVVAVDASEELAVQLEASAAGELDLLELPPLPAAARRILGAWRFELTGPNQPSLSARTTIYQRYDVPVAIATEMKLTTQLDAQGRQNTRADIRIVNAGLQFLTVRLPGSASLWSASVDGQVVKPGRQGSGAWLLALPRGNRPVPVRLLYAVGGEGDLDDVQLHAPVLEGLQLNSVSWQVAGPQGFVISDQQGAMAGDWVYRPEDALDHLASMVGFSSYTRASVRSGADTQAAHPTGDTEMPPDELDTELPQRSESRTAEDKTRLDRDEAGKPKDTQFDDNYKAGLVARGRLSLPVELTELPDWQAGTVATYTGLGQPKLTLSFRSRSSMSAWRTVGLFAGLAGGLALLKASRRIRWAVLVVAAVLAVVLSMVSATLAPVAAGLFLGILLAAVVLGLLALVGVLRSLLPPGRGAAAAAIVLALLSTTSAAWAQPQQAQQQDQAALPPNAQDQWIIPYSGRAADAVSSPKILVPYSRYVRLWNRAYPDQQIELVDPATQLSIADAVCDVTIQQGRLNLELTARIVSRGSKWASMPFAMGQLAMTSATLGDQPAQIQNTPGAEPLLMVPPGTDAQLRVQAVAALANTGVRGQVRLTLPPLPAGVMRVRLGADDLRLEVDGAPAPVSSVDGVWLVPLPSHRRITLRWAPKPGAGAEDRTLSAAADHSVYVYQWAFVGRSEITWSFAGGQYDRFELLLPAGVQITHAGGANLRDHRVSGKRQVEGREYDVLEVRLHRPTNRPYKLDLRWISAIGQLGESQQLLLPQAGAVGRESGAVDLYAAAGMEMKVLEVTGGRRRQLAPNKTQPVAGAELVASYYWPYRPFGMRLELSRLAVKSELKMDQLVRIGRRQVQLLTQAKLSVPTGQLFGASFALPEGYELLSVRGEVVKDWFVQDQPDRRRLHVSFLRGTRQTSVAIVCVRKDPSFDPLVVPLLVGLDSLSASLEDQSGRLAVQVAPALEARTAASSAVQSIAPGEVADWLNQREQTRAVQFAYRYEGPDAAVALQVSQKPTRIRAEVTTGVSVRPDSAMYTYLLRYHIEGSPIDRLRFTLPTELASMVDVQSRALRSVDVRQLDDSGRSQWTVSLVNEVTGTVDVGVNFSIPINSQTTRLPLPVLQTAQSADGYRAVVAIQNLSRHEVSLQGGQKLSPVPVVQQQTLLPGRISNQLQYVLQSFDDSYQASLSLKQAQQTQRFAAIIDLMEVRSLIDRSGNCRYEIVLSLQNRSEQFLQLSLPEQLSLWSAQVDGQPVRPVVGSDGDGSVRVPLVKASAASLPYEVKLYLGGSLGSEISGLDRIAPPAVKVTNIPVKRTAWSLLLPEGYRYVRPEGNMSPVAGQAELMSLNVDAKIQQLSRMVKSSEYDGDNGRSQEVLRRNFQASNDYLKEQIDYNVRFLAENRDQLEEEEYRRLQDKSTSQYAMQRELEEAFNKKTSGRQSEAYNVNGLLNSSNVNWGLTESDRNRVLQDIPQFVTHAEQKMRSNLTATINTQAEQIHWANQQLQTSGGDVSGIVRGIDGLTEPGGETGLMRLLSPEKQAEQVIVFDGNVSGRLDEVTNTVGSKLLQDRASNLAKQQKELAGQSVTLEDSRLGRFYGQNKYDQPGSPARQGQGLQEGQQGQQAQQGQRGQPGHSRPDRRGQTPVPGEPMPELDQSVLGESFRDSGWEYDGTRSRAGDGREAGQMPVARAAGTFSLPVELPEEGFVRLDFVYPGSEPEISVLPVPQRAVEDGFDVFVFLAVVAVACLGGWLIRRLVRRRQGAAA
ncbi:MAG: hypothetical protein ACLFUJ_07720 [Phycisphaerae bacterium]